MKQMISKLFVALLATASLAAMADEGSTSFTFQRIMVGGGWIMNIIAALSILAIALVIFYLLTMRATLLFPQNFVAEARDLAESGDLAGLKALCAENPSLSAKIVASALEQAAPQGPLNLERMREAMEDEGGRQAGVLWQRLQYLMDVAVISPMVGLLGTVWGMMVSFSGIESGADFAKKAETLASGVSQAMYTTFGGLIVGIFAMALYDILRGRLNKLISNMESACGSILRRVTQEKKDQKL